MKLETRLSTLDDDLLFKALDVRLGGDSFTTPLKASDARSRTGPVTELHRRFSIGQIDAIRADEGHERRVNSDLKRKMGPDHNFFFIELDDVTVPTDEQLETLLDLQYEHSGVVVLPMVPKVVKTRTGDDLLSTFLDIIDRSISTVETLNNKSILGMIPSRIPRQYLDAVIDEYSKRGISSFAIDFDGRSAVNNPSWVRHLMRLISGHGMWDECLLYSINSGEGKFLKNAERILAQDFIGSGFGLDVLGLNHVLPRMPKERWKALGESRAANTVRVFDRSDYSYKKVDEPALRQLVGPLKGGLYDVRRSYNILEQHKEAQELEVRLKSRDPLEPYIRSKQQVTEKTINKLKTVRKDAVRERPRQQSLFL